jgi:hypothetical protein
MKGIERDLGEMKIPLKPKANLMCQRPYSINMRYKEKFKAEIDRMLYEGIIELVEGSEWIRPMVVHDKTTGGIRICVDLMKLNDEYLHDLFPTPFTNEVLENVGGSIQEHFCDGWGSYQYTVIPFGLNNSPALFSKVAVVAFKEFIHKFLAI